MNSYCKSFLFILLLIIILFLGFYRLSSKKNIYENYNNIESYDKYILINSISNYVIIIESNINGIIINAASTEKSAVTYSYLKMNLNQVSGDILDIENLNGQYWYFNYSSKYGTLGTNTNSCSDETNGQIIDLSQYNQNQIFENAIFFKNGTMITFDLKGTHMIIGKIPQVNSIPKVQIICALTQMDMTNLNGNTMTILYNTQERIRENKIEFFNLKKSSKVKKIVDNIDSSDINININNFYYNGGCNSNNYGTTKNNINFMDTLAIFSPTNNSVSILSFNNGCFIDGSQSGSLLRFIGIGATIQFDLSGKSDIFQIWNIRLSNYFYYNIINKIGTLSSNKSIYTKYKNYWNMLTLGMFPYTGSIKSISENSNNLSFSGIDQIIIYNPQSQNNFAILIQVDTCPYGINQGNNLPQGSNNWSLTISSIIYNYSKKTISINPNAVSKFSFNLNCAEGDIIDFIINNGGTTNNTMYYSYNSNGTGGNNLSSGSSVPPNIEGTYEKGGTSFSVFPNNLPYNTKEITLPNTKNPYSFRNNPPNQLIFENTINFMDNVQLGIDINGNCILKGKSCQVEFNIAKTNMGSNLNIFGINSSGEFEPQYNNFIYNGTTNQTSIGNLFNSGTIQVLEDTTNQSCFSSYLKPITETTGNYIFGIPIQSEASSYGGPFWSCQNMEYNLKNGFILQFLNGYQNSYGEEILSNSIALLDYKITPLTLVSESKNNIINETTQNSIMSLQFSNGMEIMGSSDGLFQISGLYSIFSLNTDNTSSNLFQIENNINNNMMFLEYETNNYISTK